MNVARDYRLGDHLISSSLRAACEIPEGVHRAGSSELQAGAALFIDPAEPGVEELLSSARVAESPLRRTQTAPSQRKANLSMSYQ